MQLALTLIIGWLADWLVRQVPTLDPAQSREVARVLVDHGYQIGFTALLVGWRFLRRPGDIPAKDLPKAAVFHIPGFGNPGREPGKGA